MRTPCSRPGSPFGCGRFDLYGQGCPTCAGRTPQLEANGCAVPGGSLRVQVHGGIAGHPAFVALGAQQASIPLPGGCTLLAAPILPSLLGPIALNANGLFAGAALVTTSLPGTTPTGTIRTQAFVADPGSVKGFAATNGLEIQIAP